MGKPWYAKMREGLWATAEEMIRKHGIAANEGKDFIALMDLLCTVTALELLERIAVAVESQEKEGH